MHASTLAATWKRQQSTVASCSPRTLSSHMLLPRRPLQPVLRNSGGVDIRLDRLREQVAIPPRCEPPLPSACRALGLSVGVVGKFSQPVTQHSQCDLPDEHDTRSAFPSYLSKSRLGRSRKEIGGGGFNWFLARVIREARLRVQGNLETVVEFLLRLRRPGRSRVDHWLRPEPAKMAPFITGPDKKRNCFYLLHG